MLQEIALGERSLSDYTHLVGRGLIEEIRELAEPLAGKRVLHVSATAFGGGVSEILYTQVPLMRDVGLDDDWDVIVVHDPQPAALRANAPERSRLWIWRCHIDLSTPNADTLARLMPLLK